MDESPERAGELRITQRSIGAERVLCARDDDLALVDIGTDRLQDLPKLGLRPDRAEDAASDIENLRFYQRAGFRLRSIERDAFTPDTGYAPHSTVDGIELRDRVWLDLELEPESDAAAAPRSRA